MGIRFEMFHGMGKPWQELFREAAEFANQIGRERLIAIGHSSDQQDAVVCVWYWAEETAAPSPASPGERKGTKRRSRSRPRREK